jgi:hypothetical protein
MSCGPDATWRTSPEESPAPSDMRDLRAAVPVAITRSHGRSIPTRALRPLSSRKRITRSAPSESSRSGASFCAPDAAGRTRPAGRRRPQTATNLCDVVLLAHAVAIGGEVATGAQRIDFWRGDGSHLSSNSAAANPPTAAVRLSCLDCLRPEQSKVASLIVEKRVSVDNLFNVRLDDPSHCFGAETIVA